MKGTTDVGFCRGHVLPRIDVWMEEAMMREHEENWRWFGSVGSLAGALGSSEHGQSMVEVALTLPLLLAVLTGIMTFGLAMNNYVVLTEATSVAARQVAISRQQTTDPCQVASSAFYVAAPNLTQSKLTFTYTFNGTAASGTSCTAAAANLKQGTPAMMNVTYPCSLIAYKFNFGACTLQTQTTEAIQ